MTEKLRRPTTPGEILREEYLIPLNITNKALAAATGLPEGSISPLVRGKGRVTYEVALRLSKYLGTTPEFWLNLQHKLDEHVLRADTYTWRQIEAIKPITEPLPVPKRGYIADLKKED
jgi:addiction module HigA family antidote